MVVGRHPSLLSAEERASLTNEAIRDKRTLVEVWTPDPQRPPSDEVVESRWGPRAQTAAAMLRGVESVLDVGCLDMELERYLAAGTRYVPLDVVKRDERTIVIDLNAQPAPSVRTEAVALLGVLEYIFDVPALLGTLAKNHEIAVISYSTLECQRTVDRRRSRFWVNEYSNAEMENFFLQNYWRVLSWEAVANGMIWKLASFQPAV